VKSEELMSDGETIAHSRGKREREEREKDER
jgi:hypothetical protein